ncbi:MAG: N-acetylmuramoyl-L-alanine amidase [Fibrobacterota bacterium]
MKSLTATLALCTALFAGREISVRDTLVNGIPYVRFIAGPGVPGDLKIAEERGVLRASLEGSADSVLVVFDRNPFAQMSGRTRPLQLVPRVTKTRLVLPLATSKPLLERLGLASASQATATPSAPAAPTQAPAKSIPVAKPIPVASPKIDSAAGVVAEVAPPPPLAPDVVDSVESAPVTESVAIAEKVAKQPDPLPDPSPKAAASVRPEKKGIFTVVIDAGHGGKDPGAIGKLGDQDVMEKMATLQVARKIRDELSKHKGIKVVMTRDKDVFLELGERTKVANDAKGELFVSLHCNSLPLNSKRRDEVDGFMVYLLREAKDENDRAIERRENAVIKFETGERAKKQSLDPVEWMMLEHQLNLYTKESERFAGLVVQNLSKEGTVEKERTGAGQAGFFVLVGALMPSVLIEMGYVSNPRDAVTLSDPAKQQHIAEQIAKAIEEFRRSRR